MNLTLRQIAHKHLMAGSGDMAGSHLTGAHLGLTSKDRHCHTQQLAIP